MKRIAAILLMFCLAAGLAASGCNKDSTDKGTDTKTEEQSKEKAGVIESKEIADFGKSFCDAIAKDPESIIDYLNMSFQLRLGLEMTMDEEKRSEMEAMGLTMEKLTEMGLTQMDAQIPKFAKLGKDIGQCTVESSAEVACSEISTAFQEVGFMGKKKLDAEMSNLLMDVFAFDRCGTMGLGNEEGESGTALLGATGDEWKILSIAKD